MPENDATKEEPRLLAPGDPVGELALLDQHGARRSLADFRGKALALTFVFTRCPLPNFCPALDRGFSRLQGLLSKDPPLAARVQLLSLSFDPAHDTYEVLARHAARVGADGGSWLYATAKAEDVDRFGAGFGLEVHREAQGGMTHNLRTALVDPQGRLGSVVTGSDWKAEDVIAALRRLTDKP